jgi:hypothetical protein
MLIFIKGAAVAEITQKDKAWLDKYGTIEIDFLGPKGPDRMTLTKEAAGIAVRTFGHGNCTSPEDKTFYTMSEDEVIVAALAKGNVTDKFEIVQYSAHESGKNDKTHQVFYSWSDYMAALDSSRVTSDYVATVLAHN